MALANLNINVNANVSNVVNAMADVKAVTHASMLGSSGAVTDFQKDFAKSAGVIGASAKTMSADMGASSIEISKAAQLSADSISGISAAADATVIGVKEMGKGLDAAGKQMEKAIGPEASAQMKTMTGRVEEFVGTRLAIAAVGITLGAVAAGAVAVGVAAYHAAGFLGGLITGESYKSAAIDALIAETDKVKDLQKELGIAAVDAAALHDALGRLGVDKGDYGAVKKNAESALRNEENAELDRLGVAWKGQDTAALIQNAKKALDEYTEGWDRNQAAAAMGLGTYEQINQYLKVGQDELQKSKHRLDDFGLGMGPDTEAAVERYQAAMREFNNENELMGKGFKRVIADTTMPILTNFAEYLKDGWPSAVNFFRGVSASFASILLGLDSAAYIMVKGVAGSLSALMDEMYGVVGAMAKLASGDAKGAWAELVKGHQNAEKTMAATGDAMVKHAKETVAALKLAWAFDDRTNPLGGKPKKGKGFVSPPDAEDDSEEEDYSRVNAYIREYNKLQEARIALGIKEGPVQDELSKNLATINAKYKDLIATYPEYRAELERNLKIDLADAEAIHKKKDAYKDLTFYFNEYLQSVKDSEAHIDAMGVVGQREANASNADEDLRAAMRSHEAAGQFNSIMAGDDPYKGQLLQIENARAARLEMVSQWDDAEIGMAEKKAAALAKIDQDYADAKRRLDMDMADRAAGSLSNSMATIGNIMMKGNKDQFEAGKAFAIAAATVDTARAAVGAWAAMSSIPVVGPALGGLAAGVAVASGLAQIAMIQSAQYQPRAKGGPVTGGETYLVGEKGPELFTAGASGQITSNDNLKRLGGGQSINVTVVNQMSPGLAGTVQAEIMRSVPALTNAAVAAVRRAINGGTELSAAVGRM